jgi:signal transduction histidine kinase
MVIVIAVLATITIGLYSIFLSLENDSLREKALKAEQTERDRIYKISVVKDLEEKIAYLTDHEKLVDTIMSSMQNFFNYSVASSMVVKDRRIIFKTYIEENVGPDYLKKIEESMLSSFEKLVGKTSHKITRKSYGMPADNPAKSGYLSSFHLPLIANNKVLALIHLSSTKENAYPNMEDLRDLIDKASSALTHFSQAVNQETEKLSDLIDSLSEGIFMVDNKNNLLTINSSSINVSAKKILELYGNVDFTDITKIFPKELNLEDKIKDVMLNKIACLEKGVQVGTRTLDLVINPAGHDKVSVVLRDVSDLKKKELQKEDLIHIMVHELRSPVTTIKDSADLIITSKDDLEQEKKDKFMAIIYQQSKKVLGQIGAILDTAKLDAGKLILQKTKGDIAKLIQDETQTFMPQAERKSISLTSKVLNKQIPEIAFDEIRVSQVIDNLLSNSLKFTPEKGKINVEIDYKVIHPDSKDAASIGEFFSLDKYIIISVSDNGVGISSEQQKYLFSKYTQAKNTTEELATKGTGLGLYLAKGIIEAHGGRIWVKSVPGQGTTFSFTLPATRCS